MSKENVKEKDFVDEKQNQKKEKSHLLVLYNDEINTFDFVIDSLVEICKHSPEQAEQCTMIAHLKGSCDVKKGVYETLKPIKEKLNSKGLRAVIL